MKRINLAILALALPATVAAQPATMPTTMPTTMIEPARPAAPLTGYLADRSPLALVRLLPPPPLPGSSEDSADRYLYRLSKRGIGGAEWRKAQGQLGIGSPDYQKAVACALGAAVAAPATANTMKLLQRAGADLARAVTAAKEYHKRARPFTTDRGKACDPASAVDGGKALGFAYPSGHAAVGWLWGLILADARPERSAALLKFGKETGDLRIACRVHWASDVAGGRLMATALYQQIADTADYKADLAKASAELSLAPVPEGCPAG